MPDVMQVTNSILAGVHPSLDDAGQLLGLTIDVALEYTSSDGGKSGRQVSIDVWELMSETQRANMQDIQNTINTEIVARFFA